MEGVIGWVETLAGVTLCQTERISLTARTLGPGVRSHLGPSLRHGSRWERAYLRRSSLEAA